MKRQATEANGDAVNGAASSNGASSAATPSAEVIEERLNALQKIFPKKVGKASFFLPNKIHLIISDLVTSRPLLHADKRPFL